MWKVISPHICRESAQRLQQELNEDYPIRSEKVINWGNSAISSYEHIDVFGNKLEAVARSSDKRTMFRLCKKHGTVPLLNIEDPVHLCGYYIHEDPYGHNGSGVRFAQVAREIVHALSNGLLVTRAVKGKEFRAYFAYGDVLEIYKKVRVEETGDESSQVHNSVNGWGYLSNPPELRKVSGLTKVIKELTIACANTLELSYGAVDFIMDDEYRVWVLESNSAPTLITNELTAKFAFAINQIHGEEDA